jgi:voltage-gated potassium channel
LGSDRLSGSPAGRADEAQICPVRLQSPGHRSGPAPRHVRDALRQVDSDAVRVAAAQKENLAARQIDYTDDDALRGVGIGSQVEGVFCLFTEDSENVFLAISARTLDPRLRIVAVCQAPEAAPKLLAAGADKVVDPYEISGARVHELIQRPEVVDLLEQTVFGVQDLNVAEITIPRHSWLHGVHLSGLRKAMNQNLILLGVVDLERGRDLSSSAPAASTTSWIAMTCWWSSAHAARSTLSAN